MIPKELIVSKYFAKEQDELNKAKSELESATAQITEMAEEHGGDEGLFSELEKINKANVNARLKEIKKDKDAAEEVEVLKQYLALCEKESLVKKKVKELDLAIDELSLKRYPKLKEEDIKELVVNDKWMGTLDRKIHKELERVTQSLTFRIKYIVDLYNVSLPDIISECSHLEMKFNHNLQSMGF